MKKMVSVYNDADYLAIYKQKRKLWAIFCVITALYLIYCVAWLIFHISLPYKDPMQKLAQWMVFLATGLYVIFIFPYLAIKYSRVRRYYKLIGNLSSGLKNEEKNYYYCWEEKSLQKDNIDVIGCVFETWNKKKCEWMDREAYFDLEKPLPDFDSGDYVQYITQSNFIVQYRILQKQALEFEEVDEDGASIDEGKAENEGETGQPAPESESVEERATDEE
ncbi:MAG: hypothetical protein IJ308_05155 [Clostridia bacterium]|nr:hypothetical protein [Clostridia bacterium]